MTDGAERYQPVGHMTMSHPRVMYVDFVTLDGERVEAVFELDDVEGWVRYYGANPEIEGDEIRHYKAEGEVRVHWKNPESGA